jgi:branched-chain amino acid aminotransferase
MYLTYFNDSWHEGNAPLVGAMDHSVWLGSTIFDGARAIRGHLPDLRLHLQRAVESSARLGLRCPYTVDAMERLVRDGVARFSADAELYIRILVFGTDGLLIPVAEKSGFALTLFDAALPPLTGFSACLSPYRRPDPSMAPTDSKASALYANTTRALREAQSRGFDNAVVRDSQGNVAEFSTANLFLVTPKGDLVTPVGNGSFLCGITRARVIALLGEAGIKVGQRTVRPEELDTAMEIFNTGNYGKVVPCTRYGERELAVGPFATLARERYMAFVANS